MRMIYYSDASKTHFHKKDFALCLLLKVGVLELDIKFLDA